MAGRFPPLVEISFCVSGGALLPSCVFYFLFLVCIMVLPFANRAAVASLPALALASKPATIKDVIEDFAKQCPHISVLECVQLIKGRTLRVVFPSTEVMEDMISGGLTFRDHPIQFKAPSVYKWVTLLDLPYGIPESEIKTVLSKFGQVAHIRSESYKGLYTGTRQVKMEIRSAIPSRVIVAGHPCTIFYRGQVRSCFRCGQTGHEAKNCPQRAAALSRPTTTISVVPPTAPSETTMSTEPPTSPRTFATVVSGQVVPPAIGTLPPNSISPFPKEVLSLPLGPVDVTALTIANDPPGMDTDVQSHKRPLSPVSVSEETDTGDRTRLRLEEQPPTEPTILDPGVRDRSPIRQAVTGNDSTSDSSGKSTTSNASVIDPPTTQSTVLVEPPLQPTSSLDRRPLSTRYREYCLTAPEYSTEEAAGLVESMIEDERQLASSMTPENRAEIELQQVYDHLQLDHNIAVTACNALDQSDPRQDALDRIFNDAVDALATFKATHPAIVRAAEELFGAIEPEHESGKSHQQNPSDSPSIPDGQPSRPCVENPSSVDSPLLFVSPAEETTDTGASTTKSGLLKTNRRSRHQSPSPTELASCVRTRTTPALPGGRRKTSTTQHQPPPDSPYTPLVTDSGYLVTDTPKGTPTARPQRPDTGAAGAISLSPSSVNPSAE